MPDLTGQASTLRGGKHRFQGYIGVLPQTIVHNGTLSATPTFPVQTIAITTVGGSAASVKRGMTVRIESSGGTLKGYCRVASSGTISATSLPVNETSKGVVNFTSGDVFKVYDTFRIWDMLVSATAALNKDSRIAYSDQGSNPSPIANAGGGFFGFTDDGQTYATVSFPGTSSLNVDPDSSSKTYSWTVVDGTITVGTSTTGDITATFPVGFRNVQLVTTDANGKATTRQFPVRVYNRSTTRPFMVSEATLNYSEEDGWSANFQLPKGSESDISGLPDGALVCFFLDEYYGDTRVSYRSNVSGRSHMVFMGYLVRNSVSVNALNNTVTFEALSPLGILNKTPALPQLMVNTTGAGTKWRQVKTLNTNRMVWYLVHYGSTADNYFDIVWQLTGSVLTYRRIAVTETSSIGAQLRDIAQSVNLKVTCDMLGRLLFIQDFDYLSSANRSSRTVVYNFTTQDIREFEFTNEHRGIVKFVRGEGITDGTTNAANKPCFSNSPGNAPAPFGTGSDTLSRQIVDDQTDLNARTGFHFAKVNGLYDGQFVPQGARLHLPPGYFIIDPAYNEPFTITLPAASNKRGASFSTATRWTAASASVNFDGARGLLDPTYTVNHETTGQPGTTYVKPQASQNSLPSFPPIDLAMPPPVIPAVTQPLVSGTATIAIFAHNDTGFWYTTDFDTPSASGGPTWTFVSLTGSINGTIVSVVADPWSPKYIGTGNTVNIWLATTTRLYTITDLFAMSSRVVTQRFVFTRSVSSSGEALRVLSCERAAQNFVVCASNYSAASDGVYLAVSTDGTTFTETRRTAFYNSSSDNTPGVWVSGKVAGTVYLVAYTATGAGLAAATALYKSTDYGSSWSTVSGWSGANSLGRCLHIPWAQSTDRYLYYTQNTATPGLELYELDMTTGTLTSIDPVSGANTAGTHNSAIAMDSSVLDRRVMVISGVRLQAGLAQTAVYTTYNAGRTWTQRNTETTSNRIQGVRFVPNSNNKFYFVGGTANAAGYSADFGITLDSHLGNISGFSDPVGIIGG